jgi:hypothetical protein
MGSSQWAKPALIIRWLTVKIAAGVMANAPRAVIPAHAGIQ